MAGWLCRTDATIRTIGNNGTNGVDRDDGDADACEHVDGPGYASHQVVMDRTSKRFWHAARLSN